MLNGNNVTCNGLRTPSKGSKILRFVKHKHGVFNWIALILSATFVATHGMYTYEDPPTKTDVPCKIVEVKTYGSKGIMYTIKSIDGKLFNTKVVSPDKLKYVSGLPHPSWTAGAMERMAASSATPKTPNEESDDAGATKPGDETASDSSSQTSDDSKDLDKDRHRRWKHHNQLNKARKQFGEEEFQKYWGQQTYESGFIIGEKVSFKNTAAGVKYCQGMVLAVPESLDPKNNSYAILHKRSIDQAPRVLNFLYEGRYYRTTWENCHLEWYRERIVDAFGRGHLKTNFGWVENVKEANVIMGIEIPTSET